MIFSGQLTETLEFYHIVETQSASGYKTVTEQYYLTCRAYRAKNKENYVVNANELFHVTDLTFILRDRKDILDTDIVVYNGERYRIVSTDRYNRNELTIIINKINE